MPLIGTRGAASSRGFGQFGNVESAPFIVMVQAGSGLFGAKLFEDGSLLVGVYNGGGISQWTVLATGTHSPGTTRQINTFSDFYTSQSSPTSAAGTLAYNEAFARVDRQNNTLAAKVVQNGFAWGGSPGASTAYVESTGDTFLANGLYATSGSTATTPHIVKINSAGSIVANRNMSIDPAYNSTEYVYACSADTSNVYVVTSEGIWRLPASLGGATLYIPTGYSGAGMVSNIAIDNSGDIYFMSSDATNNGTTLFKYSAGFGAKLFSVCLSGVYLNGSYNASVGIDPTTQEPYWLIGTGSSTAKIIKTSASLVPQFARDISLSGGLFGAGNWKDVQVVGNLIAFRNQYAQMAFVFPKNGAKTGTYSVGGATVSYSSVSLPSYSSVGAAWATNAAYSTTRSFTITNASITTGTAFTVASLNL